MSARSSLLILLVSAVLLFTAGMNTISLQSLDDAFYARKGVEMARSGNFFTVTLGGEPSFQNPPLQFWIMGRSFALFGENDTAARLPIVVMAMGILLMTLRIATLTIGPTLGSGHGVGVTAIALLLITPLFVSTARGTMMEVPYAFWITAAFLAFLQKPWPWHVLMAVPIGAAMLTKSVLGLVPIVALPAVMILSPEMRRRSGSGVLTWLGLALGVAIGLSWPLHQWWQFGPDALRHHYLGQVLEPSTERFGFASLFLGYPLILVRSFEPILWPGLAGAVLLARHAWRERARDGRALLLVAWIVIPIGIVSLSAAQSSRYIFPILPPLAICGAWWLQRVLPRVAAFVTRAFAPGLACLAAAIFWIQPTMLTRDQNQVFKTEAERLRQAIPADAKVAYVGTRYWRIANPLFYYTDRPLTQMASAADLCREPQVVFVFADRDQVESLNQCGLDPMTVLDGSDWVLVKLQGRSAALRLLIPGDGLLQALGERHARRVPE